MHQTLQNICTSLEELGTAIENGWSDNRTLTEAFGWHHPSLTKNDLANICYRLSDRIKDNPQFNIEDDYNKILTEIPKRLKLIQGSVVPYFYNNHGHQSTPAYFSTMNWVTMILEPIIGWQVLSDQKAMPTQLAKKLRSINAELSEIVPEKDRIEKQIKLIDEATEAAINLPTDLENLKNSRNRVNQLETESAGFHKEIEAISKKIGESHKIIETKKTEADKLVEQCEEAYRITTTKGLAGAFDQRASKLNSSMWIWVTFLFFTLLCGACLGAYNINELTDMYKSKKFEWGIIWLQSAISLLSIGGPIWFAWIATKQITQRFRLAEDYAFKASVAKAYEGYRKEAARIDESLEARLFSSALSRLEEAPLRLVDNETYGSPWHEFFSSRSFQEALSMVPGFKNKYISAIKGLANKKNNGESKSESVESIESEK